jgi:PadR family transcriptional regulator, regulatory protein PadR
VLASGGTEHHLLSGHVHPDLRVVEVAEAILVIAGLLLRDQRLYAQAFPLHFYRGCAILPCRSEPGESMNDRIELPQGTLDLLILRTLALQPQHGWGISERVQQMSSDVLRIQQGSLYPALHRLERRGWIKANWGTSENNRRAKYYELTKSGRRQLATEEDSWRKLTAAVAQVLGPA